MITVKLIGGLGNQLFQYSLARKLALELNTIVVLDISGFEEYKLHKYSLQHFYLNNHVKISSAPQQNGRNGHNSLYHKIKNRISPTAVIVEKQFNYDDEIEKQAKRNTYLNGYWQTEKYFSEIRPVLLKDLEITKPLEGKNLEIANLIKGSDSVSLHVRRADYVTNQETLKVHGICSIDYYLNGIEHISSKVAKPVLFVFSDDIQWCKENIHTNLEMHYVDHNNADTNYEDLRLMSLCRHNIIANSSFSWWGAWLNKNEQKIVIGPKEWFPTLERNYVDVIPERWIKM